MSTHLQAINLHNPFADIWTLIHSLSGFSMLEGIPLQINGSWKRLGFGYGWQAVAYTSSQQFWITSKGVFSRFISTTFISILVLLPFVAFPTIMPRIPEFKEALPVFKCTCWPSSIRKAVSQQADTTACVPGLLRRSKTCLYPCILSLMAIFCQHGEDFMIQHFWPPAWHFSILQGAALILPAKIHYSPLCSSDKLRLPHTSPWF